MIPPRVRKPAKVTPTKRIRLSVVARNLDIINDYINDTLLSLPVSVNKSSVNIIGDEFKVYINIIPREVTLVFNMTDKQIMTAKAILRKKLYSVINNLPKCEILRQSKIVTDKVVQNAEFQKAQVVSIYLSMDNEIQTEDLLRHVFQQKKECFIPRFQVGNPIMEMIRLSSMEQYYALPKNKWNIRQPPDNEEIESIFDRGRLDLVLAPGLAFSQTGLRLGRGKGYYDRFLSKCKEQLPSFPYTIGLALNEQILPEIPIDHNDFRLDLIIAP